MTTNTCPECGVRYSVETSPPVSDAPDRHFPRACYHDGRLYEHSSGDIQGYE